MAYPGNDALGLGFRRGWMLGSFLGCGEALRGENDGRLPLRNSCSPRHETSLFHSVRPVGYPDTAIICGSLSCLEPGLIWLEPDEAEAYNRGKRTFGAVTASMKMRAEGPDSQTIHLSGTE
jgi:hypothetical protein